MYRMPCISVGLVCVDQPSRPDLAESLSSTTLPLPVLYNRETRLVVASKDPSERAPPPIVEDEAESLAKEYGSTVDCVADEEPQSRGDIDQQPLMLEVHEFNPERRFVILTGEAEASDGSSDSGKHKSDKPADDAPPKPKEESYPSRDPSRNNEKTFAHPPLERRRSRQDLPPLETDLKADTPNRQRSRSNTSSTRPENIAAQPTRITGETLLSPDVIKHGTGSRREKVYHGYGKTFDGSSRSPTQVTQSAVGDSRPRMGDAEFDSRRAGSSAPKRTSTSAEPVRPIRRLSNERVGGPRTREDYPVRSNRRENTRTYERPESDKPKIIGSRPLERETGREEHPFGPRMPGARREKTVVVQDGDGRPSSPEKSTENHGGSKSRTRMPTMPLPTHRAPAHAESRSPGPRSAATFPIVDSEGQPKERAAAPLPYPEEDVILMPPNGLDIDVDPLGLPPLGPPPAVPTHGVPLSAPLAPDGPLGTAAMPGVPDAAALGRTPAYQPPAFDPTRDGSNLELPPRPGRRQSESAGQAEALPECPRVKPVAGMMDWLTLPRSDFNICPDCYQGVFANTSFRTQFHPMLRPTDRPIACDFGVSPWYRVAWLLLLKDRHVDLRLFHQLANLTAATRGLECPGPRRATRTWLTMRDPVTQRPVRGFAVCTQCARTVETLLPNLTGVFAPLDSRGPVRAACALHFTPKRKRFVQYFDAFELASDKALDDGQPPDLAELARQLGKLSVGSACREDSPIADGLWHKMQYLPQFTVCSECFDEVVRPKLTDDNVIARNFYTKPQRLPSATCQLYSERMRDIFSKACRRNDPMYLEDKVLERMKVESDIHAKLEKLDKEGRNDEWVADQVAKLVREWQKWE
jgi:hypothetical protein